MKTEIDERLKDKSENTHWRFSANRAVPYDHAVALRGGNMDIELITGKDVAFLDSQQFVMNALLVAEASQNRLPLLDLTVTSQTTDPDGGIDAHFLWPASVQHDVLAAGANVLQFKAGKISKKLLAKEFSIVTHL